VTAARFAEGAIYPSVEELREVARSIAVEVVREAVRGGVASVPSGVDAEELIDAAAWWPDYVPYLRPDVPPSGHASATVRP
jgi:malic enzyme